MSTFQSAGLMARLVHSPPFTSQSCRQKTPSGSKKQWRKADTKLVRFVLVHALVGAFLGTACACALLATNVAVLRSLVA
jgi:hypothetical protein